MRLVRVAYVRVMLESRLLAVISGQCNLLSHIVHTSFEFEVDGRLIVTLKLTWKQKVVRYITAFA